MIISIFVSVCIFIISDKVVPIANKKAEILKNNSSISEEVFSATKEKAFLRDEKNIIYYIKKINRIERTAEKIEVIEFDEKFRKINKLFTAEKGKYDDKNKVWKFENVNVQSVGNFEKSTMEELVDTKYDSPPEKFMISMLNPKNLSISELKSEIKKYTLIGGNTSNLIYLLAKKYSFPFASIPVVLLGLALGSRHVRGGNAKHIGLTVVLGYGYYIINGMFEAFSKNDLINPFISSWIPNILFLVIGLYFVNKAER